MANPNLTFFCELEPEALDELLNESLVSDVRALNARISLGLPDLSARRAKAVRRLNEAGVPVIAWLLLPKDEGYWLNLRNSGPAFRRYLDFLEWTERENLKWAAIGLDIEPDMREIAELARKNLRILPEYARRLFARREWQKGLASYKKFIDRIHEDGFKVETYQFPLLEDERRARSSMLQRIFGIVDLPSDREVWMIYSSFVRPHGAGMLASYAPQAQSIAIGSTGGGVDLEFGDFEPLSWDEFAHDLRLSWYWCNDLYIFSLEGCVRQGFIEKLKGFAYDFPIILPEASTLQVEGWRRSLQSVLWFFSHLVLILGAILGGFLLWKGLRRLLSVRSNSRS